VPPRPSPQTDRVIAVIHTIAVAGPLSLSDLARRVDVNKSTMYSLLSALTRSGWLVRHPDQKTFHLGPELIALGRIAGEQLPVLELARPAMLELVDEFKVTARIFRRLGASSVLVDAVIRDEGAVPLRGLQYPIRAPFGAIFAAWDSRDEVDEWCNNRIARDDPARRAALQEHLAAIRLRGYLIRVSTSTGLDDDRDDSLGPTRDDDDDPLALTRDAQIGMMLIDDPVAGRQYQVHDIAGAVRDRTERSILAIQLGPFPEAMDGSEVLFIARSLSERLSPIMVALGTDRSNPARP
jgi:DNA-binding IclR family transcriptional regulator